MYAQRKASIYQTPRPFSNISSITSRLKTPRSINSHRSPIRNSSSCSGSTNGGSTTGPKLYANIMPSLKV